MAKLLNRRSRFPGCRFRVGSVGVRDLGDSCFLLGVCAQNYEFELSG